MNPARQDERIARALHALPAPPPPADLLARIHADIPAALASSTAAVATVASAASGTPITPVAAGGHPRIERAPSWWPRPQAVGFSALAHAAAILLAVTTGAFTPRADLGGANDRGTAIAVRSAPVAVALQPSPRTAGRGYIDTAALPLSRVPLDVAPARLDALHADLAADRWPVDVSAAALVNAFDYADPAPRAGEDLSLVVEGAPAPGPDPWHPLRAHMLRVGLRARAGDTTSGPTLSASASASASPGSRTASSCAAPRTVIERVDASVEFNEHAVARWRATAAWAADTAGTARAFDVEPPRSPAVTAQASLVAGEARSAVFEVDLRADAEPDDRLATLEVRYAAADGDSSPRRVRRDFFVDELAPSWDRAAPSLRVAVLAARFAEDASPSAPREVRDAYLRDVRRLAASPLHTPASPLHAPASVLAAPAALVRLAEGAARLAQAEGDRVVVGIGAARPPVLVERVEPLYPALARRARIGGTVVLSVMVDETGRVAETSVLRSVPALDRAAADAVRRWRYRPSLADGQPVPGQVFVSVTFVP